MPMYRRRSDAVNAVAGGTIMRILKRTAAAVLVVLVVAGGVAFLLPRQVHVERSIAIDAPRPTLFAIVNSVRSFNKWSPWASADPQAKYAYEGPDTGVGAKMVWSGNPATVGSGSQSILESVPGERVKTRLDFGSKGSATAEFILSTETRGTRVRWGFDADLGMNPVSRYFGLLFDRMIGPDFEKGLAGLKAFAESLPKVDFADLRVDLADVKPVTVAFVAARSSTREQDVAAAIEASHAEIGRFLSAAELMPLGPPITVNTKWDESTYEFEAAVPIGRVPDKAPPAESRVRIKDTYSGKALKVVHRGAYRDMPATYRKLFTFAAAHGYDHAGSPWEEYVSDPATTAEADLITNVYLPVK
jgi:effector-binding domain-containing protein